MAAHLGSAVAKESLARREWESAREPAPFGYGGSIRQSQIARYPHLLRQGTRVCFAKRGQRRFSEKSRAPRDVWCHAPSHFPVL
jgi:hypothetical protein